MAASPPVGRLIDIQMHENVSAGTLISPVMDSPEASAKWLSDNKAPAFADHDRFRRPQSEDSLFVARFHL
jgi:hypothetical protein